MFDEENETTPTPTLKFGLLGALVLLGLDDVGLARLELDILIVFFKVLISNVYESELFIGGISNVKHIRPIGDEESFRLNFFLML